ncbi:MAG: ParB/RepB/Spo0J family partition protein [Candidatus Bathyarchaeales archaeon]
MGDGNFVLLRLESLIPPALAIRFETEENLEELTETVKSNGVLEPLIVRPTAIEGKFEVVCGLRRLKAAEKVGLDAVPCIIRQMSDQEAMEAMLIENVQRKELSDYEVGKWLKEVLQRFPEVYPKLDVLARKLGYRDPSQVSRLIGHSEYLDSLKLMVPTILPRGKMLPERVTREVRKAPQELQPKILKTVVKYDLSSRETAELVDALTPQNIDVKEAFGRIRTESGKKKVKAEELIKDEKRAFSELTFYYPASLAEEILKRTDDVSEEKLVQFFKALIDVMWGKIVELGLVEEVFSEVKSWG